MSILQPVSTDGLNSPDHSLMHRVIAIDSAAPAQSLVVNSAGKVLGDASLMTGITQSKLGIDCGVISLSVGVNSVSFNFTFASAPVVLISTAGTIDAFANITARSTTGFTVNVGQTQSYTWIAIGTKA